MSGEKTEQPSSKKLRDAREKGQVAVSRDIASTVLLLVLFAYLLIVGGDLFERLRELMVLPARFYDVPFGEAFPQVLQGVTDALVQESIPLLGLVILFGVAANYFQVGALFVLEPVKPDLKKLDPGQKLKQIFSMKNLVEFGKSLIKVTFLSLLLYQVIKNSLPALLMVPYSGLDGIVSILGTVLFQLALYTGLAYLALGAADFFFQRWQHTKGLMMSKEEVKQDYKEMEGDPHIKSKRKHLHQEMVMGDNIEKVKKSTVLVTNPTHKAVAIYYKEGETKLPMIMAKGEGFVAQKMIEMAREAGVPIMQNVPLAQELFEHGKIEQYIPSDLIEPIAEVLRWVMTLQRQ